MVVFPFCKTLKRRAQRIRAAWLCADGRGGRSALRPVGGGPVSSGGAA
jgi:hypothetical protein